MITGGSGYFGTALNLYLSNKGHEVWSYDAGFFKDNWLGSPVKLNEKWIDARDITETDIQLYDAIIHFAGISNDPLKQLSEDQLHKPSLIYTKNLANICKKLGKKFIFASSCSVYGYSKEVVDETSQPNPLTPYSATKYQIEKILNELRDETWQPIILRFATIFGFSPRMRFDTVINMFCGMSITQNKILMNSDGLAIRPFIDVIDASRFVEAFIIDYNKTSQLTNNIFNIGYDSYNLSILEILNLLQKISPNIIVELLDNKKNLDSLFADRKILNQKDSRSYSVNFSKIKNYFDNQLKTKPIDLSLNVLLDKLAKFKLDVHSLNSTKYYRLQYLENLIDKKILNLDLRYTIV